MGPVTEPPAKGRKRQQLRRRTLPPERREEFNRRALAGEEIRRLARLFNLELCYARRHLARLLARMGAATGCPPIALPLVEEFHIDLGFDLASGRRTRHVVDAGAPRPQLSAADWRLIDALHDGLPWQPRPFQAVADAAGLDEAAVLATLAGWLGDGTLRRFGVVVKHRELGYRANAMCVWAVPESEVSRLGHLLAGHVGVSLCYRRRPDGN